MRKTYRNEITVSVKDILLAIALIPYAIFLVLGVSGCIQSSIEYEHLDLCALFDPIVDFWFDEVIEGNILFICLAVFCVGYPCFYFLDKADEKRRPEKKKGKFKIEKSFVVFILSFIPYLFLVWSCIFGIELGFFYSVSMYYGFEAIENIYKTFAKTGFIYSKDSPENTICKESKNYSDIARELSRGQ
ncbi:MAG: hypothetical protein IJZ25_01610, partial [Lachnospiraceae bacterium]|nr:hypothetical protein [Lachnospiraceae bacterium]